MVLQGQAATFKHHHNEQPSYSPVFSGDFTLSGLGVGVMAAAVLEVTIFVVFGTSMPRRYSQRQKTKHSRKAKLSVLLKETTLKCRSKCDIVLVLPQTH